jgi:hypothetical protein
MNGIVFQGNGKTKHNLTMSRLKTRISEATGITSVVRVYDDGRPSYQLALGIPQRYIRNNICRAYLQDCESLDKVLFDTVPLSAFTWSQTRENFGLQIGGSQSQNAFTGSAMVQPSVCAATKQVIDQFCATACVKSVFDTVSQTAMHVWNDAATVNAQAIVTNDAAHLAISSVFQRVQVTSGTCRAHVDKDDVVDGVCASVAFHRIGDGVAGWSRMSFHDTVSGCDDSINMQDGDLLLFRSKQLRHSVCVNREDVSRRSLVFYTHKRIGKM